MTCTRPSGLTPPTALLVGLPIRHLKPRRFRLAPARAGGVDGVRILAVEKEHHALIGGDILRHQRPLDKEAHHRAVRIVIVDRQQNRLLRGFRLTPGTVRQKGIVAPGPQMRVERLDAFFGGRLHHDPPTAVERLLQQRRQDLLWRLPLQVIEENFRHGNVRNVRRFRARMTRHGRA